MPSKNNNHLIKSRQKQLLKLVTKSFFKELVNYGVDASDIVTVSMNLLDYVTNNSEKLELNSGYYNNQFHIINVLNNWNKKKQLSIDEVSIIPLKPDQVITICEWLKRKEIKKTFIDFLPKQQSELTDYLFEEPKRNYFGIYYHHQIVGIVGAENVDFYHKTLEMKKFVGAVDFSGKGIGKKGTFLFLYHVFMNLQFNKVYIHSLDTNIHNINLNSKFGFELEGVFFQEIYRSGKYYDVVRMGLLRDHWIKIFSNPGEK
jgi:RimJ/RimL family protein N-acetyltransferase